MADRSAVKYCTETVYLLHSCKLSDSLLYNTTDASTGNKSGLQAGQATADTF